MANQKQREEIDVTETDEFADLVVDTYCPDVAEEVNGSGGLLYGLVKKTKISPGPMARREYARANKLEEENRKLRAEKDVTTIRVPHGGTAAVKIERPGSGRKHRDRADGVTDKWIAGEFNRHSVQLIRSVGINY